MLERKDINMQIINGKYNSAKVFTNVFEETAEAQIQTLCNQEFVKDSIICIMPDVHAGAGCTIGTTMTIKDKIVPNLVGVDISCGVTVAELSTGYLDLQVADDVIRSNIPAGMNIRDIPLKQADTIPLNNLKCASHVNLDRAKKSIGTLGGGNHFCEVDKDDDGKYYLVVHTGSRNLGKQVAEYYQNEAWKQLTSKANNTLKNLIDTLKADGKESEISDAIKNAKRDMVDIPKQLAYAEGELFDDYIHDMRILQEYATLNRNMIVSEILEGYAKIKSKIDVVDMFTTTHNYIDTENMILRKGAVSAQKGEKLIIPINMRDGSLICIGKGNPEWNYSAPHGAGRLFSRGATKKRFSLDDYKKSMDGIYTTSVSEETLDECPMAYKKMSDIVDNIRETVNIIKTIKPVYNFKAGEK